MCPLQVSLLLRSTPLCLAFFVAVNREAVNRVVLGVSLIESHLFSSLHFTFPSSFNTFSFSLFILRFSIVLDSQCFVCRFCSLFLVFFHPFLLIPRYFSSSSWKAPIPFPPSSYPDNRLEQLLCSPNHLCFSTPSNGPSSQSDTDQKARRNALLQEIPGWPRLHRPQRHPRDEHNRPPIRRRS